MCNLTRSCFGAWAISFLLFSSFGCKADRGSRMIRLLDELSEQNIVETPLKDLTSRFPRREEIIDKGRFVRISDEKNGEILAYPPKDPVLGGAYAGTPPEISVVAGQRTLRLTSLDKLQDKTWAFLKKKRQVGVHKILFKGDKFIYGLILPSGTASFGVSISNPQPLDYVPKLKFVLDGETVEEIAVRSQSLLEFSKKISIGKHTLGLYFDEGMNLTDTEERGACLNLTRLQILCSADLLLFPKSSSGDRLRLSYVLDPYGQDEVPPGGTERLDYSSLYEIKNEPAFSIHDAGVRRDSYSVKRKLRFGGKSINAIFAPPRSEFFFSSGIPDDSCLEFGIGLLNGARPGQYSGVRFKVTAEMGGEEFVLFHKTLRSSTDGKEPVFSSERIDLSPFSRKKARFSFLTDTDPPLKTDGQEHLGQAFWFNPIISSPALTSPDRPNVILISIDTLRADHLGCYGYSRQTSPHIDELARESVQFNNIFSPTGWTLPSHMSLLTGLTPLHHGALHDSFAFDTTIPTLADFLREEGYATGAFTGGGYVSSKFGFAKGFDFYLDEGIPDLTSSEHLFQKSFDWIQKNADKKFFLFLHTYQPHEPYVSPPPLGQCFLAKDDAWQGIHLGQYLGKKGVYRALPENLRRNVVALYDGEIRYMDETLIGPLLGGLKRLNLFDRTMIIFTSDHGEEFYDHGSWGHGRTLYNELLKVPLLIKFPSAQHKRQKIDSYTRLVDILPTVLEELGISYSPGRFDGKSLFPLLRGKEKESREFFGEVFGILESPSPLRNAPRTLRKVTINDHQHKLILSIKHDKYLYFFSPPPSASETLEIQVFDLLKDPGERINLAREKQDVVRKLLAKIDSYYAGGKKRPGRGEPRSRSFDQSLAEQLKALGYLH